ncbi:MAG: SdrD B-like domain-containing protein [Chthoniobacteraceae bacterium]
MKTLKPTSLLSRALIAVCGVFSIAVSSFADPACVLPTRAQQPFTPPIRIQLPDGTNGIEVNSTGSPATFVKMTLKNVPTGYSITNGTYVAWCIEAATALCPRDVPQCLNSIYKPLIYSSYDTVSLTAGGFSLAGWNQVNYIINNKAMWAMAGYNVSEVQAAIWRFVGFNAGEEASILSGGYGFGFPAGNAANVTNIYNQANSFGATFVPVAGQLLAVVVELPAALQDEVADADKFKAGQPCIIEVVCTPPGSIGDTVFCDLNSNGIQEAGDLGIPGVKLTLSCITPQGTITKTAVTDSNGKYLFSGLAAGTCTVTVDKTTLPADCNKDVPNCPATMTVNLAAGQVFLDADFCFTKERCVEGVIGPVDLSGLVNNYLFYFADGSVDANWQGATKGFAGNVLVDGKIASERTSGGVPFAGTIVTSDSTLGAWQSIINQNPTQAVAVYNQMALLMSSKAKLLSAMATIDGLIVTPGYSNRSATSLDGTNTMNGIPQTIVINVTSGFQVSSKINILGDASDVFILRWDTDSNPANGYQGQVKFQSGGAICPQGGLKASNFVHVAGDINASGGGSNPAAPYPQGPRTNNGTGTLISGAQNFNGGGFFTGYWLTTGDPVTGQTAPLSNAIFVGGWYTCSKKFSLTSGTSGVYVAPNCPGSTTTVSGCVYVDLNCNGIRDGGLGTASQWGIFVINGGDLIMNSSNIVGSVALGPQSTGSTLQKTNISGKFTYDPTSTWDQSNLSKDFKVAGGIMSQSLTQAQNDANTASSSFAAMSPTQTFGNVTSSLTITGNGGLNVIKISSLSYNSKTLTLKGGPGDIFIINVAGGWTFADSKITLNGVTAGQVVFNFPTTGSTIQMYKATNVINGTFLAPQRSVIYHNPASFNGQIIAKGLNIHSDANLTSVPLTAAEPCLPGVTVRLSNGTSTTQVTTATGFLFANVAPSTYSITETIIPAGYSFFRANPGSAGGTAATVAPAVFPAQNAIQNIPIASGTNATGYDFGLKRN